MTMKKMYKKAGLKGGQVKLDKNKDGKLSGADFKMMKKGGKKMMYGKGGKKKMMGGQQTMANPPAASFLEQPTAQPFQGDPSVANTAPTQNPGEFVAKHGGVKKKKKGGLFDKDVRALRRKQREERRADRALDRQAVKDLKSSSKKQRNAKAFTDGSGPIVEMTREERKADRSATRKASRTFKRQERKSRRQDKRDDRTERRTLRDTNKQEVKDSKTKLVNKKLSTLNESESSSKKTQPFIGPKQDPNKGKTTVVKKDDTKKTETKKVTNHGVTDDMSFSKAFRAGRNSHGGDGGVFTWKGKKYGTDLKKKENKKEKSAFEKAFETARTKGGSQEDSDVDYRTFEFEGKTYSTLTKEEVDKGKTGSANYSEIVRGKGEHPLNDYGKAFAKARAEGKSSFMFNGKSHATNVKGEKSKQKTMTDFQKAYDVATKGKKTTFMHKGKKYKSGYKAPKKELNS